MSELPETVYVIMSDVNPGFGKCDEYGLNPNDTPYHHTRIVQAKDARIAELEAQLKEREGWAMVPVEPTDEQIKEAIPLFDTASFGYLFSKGYVSEDDMRRIYKAMIAARPNASTEGV